MDDIEFQLQKRKLKLNKEKHYLDYAESTQAPFTLEVMSTPLGKKLK